MLCKGIFWLLSGYDGSEMLYCIKTPCDRNGVPNQAGRHDLGERDRFSYSEEWAKLDLELTGGHDYRYSPHGRVEIENGVATLHLPEKINTPHHIDKLRLYFGLWEKNGLSEIRVQTDGIDS